MRVDQVRVVVTDGVLHDERRPVGQGGECFGPADEAVVPDEHRWRLVAPTRERVSRLRPPLISIAFVDRDGGRIGGPTFGAKGSSTLELIQNDQTGPGIFHPCRKRLADVVQRGNAARVRVASPFSRLAETYRSRSAIDSNRPENLCRSWRSRMSSFSELSTGTYRTGSPL